ncbi:MAG: histidinol-phosphate transaminase [Bacteroidota bacterium]|nr:histidinol-phosphate transaminase [Candidatus Kapabacteria bacterium]MDW8219425.1 histidinol-phosphate transaminase [Bacteroidota bacterium]
MRPLHELVRKHILSLTPYSSARSEYPTHGSTVATTLATIFLDANENAFGSPNGMHINRYPDPLQTVLKRKIVEVKGLPSEYEHRIFLGNGSDEPIDLLMRIFCEPCTYDTTGAQQAGDEIIITPPTYGMYDVSAAIHHVAVRHVPLVRSITGKHGIFVLDADAVLAARTPRTKLIMLCSPNNPTGNVLEKHAVMRIIEHFDGIVVLDEAYIDFAPEHSFLPMLAEFPNLVILQTLSKAWGMAALRLGMAFADTAIIRLLNAVKPPYNVNLLTQEAACKALDNQTWYARVVHDTIRERERIVRELTELESVECVFASNANFVLVRISCAHWMYEQLVQRGIIVRDRSRAVLCEDCLRITVGTPEENAQLLRALRELQAEYRPEKVAV